METQYVLLISTLIIGFVVLGYLIVRRGEQQSDAAVLTWLTSMQKTIEHTQRSVGDALRDSSGDMTKTLQANSRQLNERLDSAAQVIGDLKKQLGELSEVGRGIKSLQEFLQSPKLRGGIGEQVLSDMIGQTFPKHSFHLQYSFRTGAKVDAILKTDAGMLPIDAKFPMENFTLMHRGDTEQIRNSAKKSFITDVKKHISDIGKKYILPEEGTLDFALMYIPSESIYYEVVNTTELMNFASSCRVYPVSPSTMYAHMQVLLTSFQGKELETKSREVFRLLRAIQKDYEKIEEHLGILGRHITNAHNTMSSVHHSFGAMGQKLNKTHIHGIKQEDLLSDVSTSS